MTTETVRGFYITNEAWHFKYSNWNNYDFEHEIMIGMYEKDGNGGTDGEFAITWRHLGNDLVPKLEAFDDSWSVLVKEFSDVLEYMSSIDGDNISPSSFAEHLKSLGLVDLTKRSIESNKNLSNLQNRI